MCCPLEQINGSLVVQSIALIENEHMTNKVYSLRCVYDRSPVTLADRVFRLFQRLELVEKIAEFVDESFHLVGSVFQGLQDLHHSAHQIDDCLHSFCSLNDVTRLINGNFFEYEDTHKSRFDYLRSAARVCHAINHILATTAFLSSIKGVAKYIPLHRFEQVFKYAAVFSALGYAMWTISLLRKKHEKNFTSDLGIHLAGCLFTALPYTKALSFVAPYAKLVNKITAFAGMIHASCVIQRLLPSDQEELTTHFVMPVDAVFAHSPHVHHSNHAHDGHSHEPCFHQVKMIPLEETEEEDVEDLSV